MKNWIQIFSGIEHAQRKIDKLRKWAIVELLDDLAQAKQNFNHAEPAFIDKAITELAACEEMIIRVMGNVTEKGEALI